MMQGKGEPRGSYVGGLNVDVVRRGFLRVMGCRWLAARSVRTDLVRRCWSGGPIGLAATDSYDPMVVNCHVGRFWALDLFR